MRRSSSDQGLRSRQLMLMRTRLNQGSRASAQTAGELKGCLLSKLSVANFWLAGTSAEQLVGGAPLLVPQPPHQTGAVIGRISGGGVDLGAGAKIFQGKIFGRSKTVGRSRVTPIIAVRMQMKLCPFIIVN
ncbi:hypothetical protein BaRGS_00000367 [Batillaria attramentaria]|uniref:Uncharacterized protein n=1 Tax=Batillaria attramentaria TaxID=370345 RepID=A0ABD0MA53_9CAEN